MQLPLTNTELTTALTNLNATVKKIVSRTAATLPATTQTPYFTVTGRVLVTQIVGEVTTEVQAQACNLDLWSNPSVGSDSALCAVLDINADAVGTIYAIDGVAANAMIATIGPVFPGTMIPAQGILIPAGTIDLKTSATNTGATKWTLHYIPLDNGSTVVAA